MEIFKIFGSIFLKSDEADKTLDKIDKKAKETDKSFGDVIATTAKWGAAVGTGALAAGAAIVGIASSASDTASRVADMSAKIGLSTKGFQEWDYVLSQAGVDVGVLQGGFKKFAGAIDDAAKGGKNQAAAFKELGISLTDTNGKVKSTEQLFNESVTAFTNMESGAHKSALANDLFGKSSTEMGAILNGTATDLTEAKDRANELGLVMSQQAIDAGDKLGDTMDNLKSSVKALWTGIGVQLMPTIQAFSDWIIANMPTIKATAGAVFEGLKLVVIGTVDAVKSLTAFFQEHWGIIQPILVGIGAGAVTFGLYTLAINAAAIATGIWSTVTAIATTVGTAFGAVMAFIVSPIGFVVIAIGLLVAAGVLLYKNWDYIKEKANALFTWLGDIFSPIFDTVKNAFSVSINAIKEIVSTTFGFVWENIMKPFYTWLFDTFKVIFDVIKIAFDVALALIWFVVEKTFNYIKETVLLPIYNWLKKIFSPIFEVIEKAFSTSINAIKDFLVTTFGFIWDSILKPYYSWLFGTFKLIFDVVLVAFDIALTAIKNTISSAFNAIKSFIEPVYNWLKDTFSGVFNVVKTALKTAWDGLGGIVSKIWDGIKSTFTSGINEIIGFINKFIKKINSIKIKIPAVEVPGVGKVGGQTFGFTIPEIPMLAKGGDITEAGRVLVGEQGPEFLDLPKGAKVSPLDKSGDIHIHINNPHLFNERDADKLGQLIVGRLRTATGLKI